MATGRAVMTTVLLLVLFHVAPSWSQTMSAQDKSALIAVREALENKERFPVIRCYLGYSDPFKCDKSGHVTWITLEFFGLKGRIAPEIGNLTKIRNLFLGSNYLSGSIPSSIGRLKSLQRLTLADNWLTGSIPWSIGQLTSLNNLHLFDNKLSGSIPWSIGQLTSLKILSLYENQLSGWIPSSIGRLKSVQKIILFENKLSGSIPSSMGQLTSLMYLVLSTNRLTGSVPSSFGQLKSLRHLGLSGNQLTGGIPPSFGQLKSLTSFSMENNYFIGPIFRVNGTGTPRCPELAANCLFGSKLPSECKSYLQRSKNSCDTFCNATQVGGPCGGNGICSNSTDGKSRICTCIRGYTDIQKKYTCYKSTQSSSRLRSSHGSLSPPTHSPLSPPTVLSPSRHPLHPHPKPPLRSPLSPPPLPPPPSSHAQP